MGNGYRTSNAPLIQSALTQGLHHASTEGRTPAYVTVHMHTTPEASSRLAERRLAHRIASPELLEAWDYTTKDIPALVDRASHMLATWSEQDRGYHEELMEDEPLALITLGLAAARGDAEVIREWVGHNMPSPYVAMWLGLVHGLQPEIADILVSRARYPRKADNGWTILHDLAVVGERQNADHADRAIAILKAIMSVPERERTNTWGLDIDAPFDSPDDVPWTGLDIAVRSGRAELVEAFLEHGATPSEATLRYAAKQRTKGTWGARIHRAVRSALVSD